MLIWGFMVKITFLIIYKIYSLLKMNKLHVLTVLLSLCLAGPGRGAITIAGNNLGGNGRLLADASGTALPTGSLVRIGYFTNPGTVAASLAAADVSAIEINFVSLGTNALGAGNVATGSLAIGNVAGRFSYSVQNIQQSTLPADRLMFYWVFNAPSVAAATQWALFTNDDTSGGGSPWLSKTDDPGIPGSGDLSLAVQLARVDDASDVLAGTLNASQLRLVVIPEPTVSLLLGFVSVLLWRRQRHPQFYSHS